MNWLPDAKVFYRCFLLNFRILLWGRSDFGLSPPIAFSLSLLDLSIADLLIGAVVRTEVPETSMEDRFYREKSPVLSSSSGSAKHCF